MFLVDVICLVTFLYYFCKVCFLCHVWSLKFFLTQFSGQPMIAQRFLKCVEPISLPAFANRPWSMLWHTLNALSVYNSALAFTSYLHRASTLTKSERVGLSQAFPGHYLAHAHGLQQPRNMLELFKILYEHFIPKFLLLSFWSASSLPQLLSLFQVTAILNSHY